MKDVDDIGKTWPETVEAQKRDEALEIRQLPGHKNSIFSFSRKESVKVGNFQWR